MPTTPDREAARARARAALAAMTEEEGAALTAAAEADPDNPPVDEATMATMRPADAELIRAAQRARGQRGPGRKPAKVQVALRLDAEVLEAWRATGEGWQTRMGEVLRRAVGR
ncbi:BrnA antitoxin family protein [Segnochrobactraceae bacterium EtOH-i3]